MRGVGKAGTGTDGSGHQPSRTDPVPCRKSGGNDRWTHRKGRFVGRLSVVWGDCAVTWIVRFLKISRSQWPWMTAGIVLGVVVIAANTLLMALSGWFIASMAVSGSSGAAFNY